MHGAVVLDQVVDELAALAGGAGLVLELVDRGPGPGRRARFYALHLQPALWGAVDVVRTWGRLGHRHRPRCLVTSHPDEGSARVALRGLVRRRLRRGYHHSVDGVL
jgi:predicted DNA-binding WGR domain protein